MPGEDRAGLFPRIRQMVSAPHRLERAAGLLEIRANRLFDGATFRPDEAQDWDSYAAAIKGGMYGAGDWARAGDEAARAVGEVAERADAPLPCEETFPRYFNADRSLALMAYCFARVLKPAVVVETGVAYGFMTAVLLEALDANGTGRLDSIDFPSLDDPGGRTTGMLVPASRRARWALHVGSSRRLLPDLAAAIGQIDMFVHDSANVSSIQKFEVGVVWPRLAPGAIVVINNARPSIVRRLSALTPQVSIVCQLDKPGCVTAVAQRQARWQGPDTGGDGAR